MKMNVVGISERRQGTGSKSGKAYDGTSLHCTLVRSKDVIEGTAVKEIYVNHLSIPDCPKINVGDLIDVSYDDKGYIEDIEIVKTASQSKSFPSAPVTSVAKK